MNEKIQKTILLTVAVLAMSLAIGYLVFAWVEPSQTPPGGNVPAPINVSTTTQTKLGGLNIATQTGNVGIGTTTTSPYVGLDVRNSEPLGNRGQIIVDTYLLRNTTNLAYVPSSAAAHIDVFDGNLCIVLHNWSGIGGKGVYLATKQGENKMGLLHGGNVEIYSGNLSVLNGGAYFAGNVGIGTTTPAYKLDVQGGDIRSSGYVRGETGLCIGTDCRTSWPTVTGEAYWKLSGSNLYTSSTNWNVGIGTTNPAGRLHVQGQDDAVTNVFFVPGADTGAPGRPYIRVGIGTTTTSPYVGLDVRNSEPLSNRGQIITNTYFLRNSTGNAYAPNDFAGWIDMVNNDLILNTRYSDPGVEILFQIPGGLNAITRMSIGSDGNVNIPTGGLIANSYVTSNSGFCIGSNCITSWPTGGETLWVRSGSNIYTSSTAWNVGIGTTGPREKLDVRGNILSYVESTGGILGSLSLEGKNTTAPNPYLTRWTLYNMRNYAGINGLSIWEYYDANNNGSYCDGDGGACSARVTIANGGNVGIGITNPAYKLDIVGDRARLQTLSGTGGPYFILKHGGEASGREFAIGSSGSGNTPGVGKFEIYDNTAGASRLVIDSNGNVGIGTPAPTVKLDVRGWLTVGGHWASNGFITLEDHATEGFHRIAFNQLRFYEGGVGDMVTFEGGNVGIGTTDTKGAKLYVSGGDIYVDSGKGLRSYTGNLIIDAHSTGGGTVYMYDDVNISGNLTIGGRVKSDVYIDTESGSSLTVKGSIHVGTGSAYARGFEFDAPYLGVTPNYQGGMSWYKFTNPDCDEDRERGKIVFIKNDSGEGDRLCYCRRSRNGEYFYHCF